MRDHARTPHADYVDFELEVCAGTERVYPVVTRSAQGGEARGAMRFPYDELELERQLHALETALLRAGAGPRRLVLSEHGQRVQEFGRALFEALFVPEIRSRYDESLHRVQDQDQRLRLRLRIEAPELAMLPWEFLYDPQSEEYLCLSQNVSVVRYLELPEPVPPLTVGLPLHVLGMVASPKELPALNVDDERRRVEEALRPLQADGLVELEWLDGHTWRDLQQAMWDPRWHVFHFIGHGGFDRTADEGFIALTADAGQLYRCSATNLGRLLAGHRSLSLVLLNVCEGARGSERDLFSSTAAGLIRRGVPAVLAMQHEITDAAAIEFSRTFYLALAGGLPVDAAVSQARVAISMALADTFEWGTPVLHMRARDGVLFELTGQAERATRPKPDDPAEAPAAPPSSPPLPSPSGEPPTGTVTFLFADIEGSTRLWEQHHEAMSAALRRHDAILRAAITEHGGHVFKTVGDAFCAAFALPAKAVDAAIAAQRALTDGIGGPGSGVGASDPSPTPDPGPPIPLRVRMALHTGTAEERDGDYFGPPLNRVARLLAAAYGDQVLLSAATEQLVRDLLPADVRLADLGEHRLRDLARPEHIFQLLHAALPEQSPSLHSRESPPFPMSLPLTRFVGRDRELAELRHLLDTTRLLTLTGAGGVGKTRLALQLAAELGGAFADGVRLVELAAVSEPALVPNSIATALAVREEAGRPLLESVVAALSTRQLLLVLDNCEHLLTACAEAVVRLLGQCPALKVLMTSRQPLRVPGEARYPVPPLDTPAAQLPLDRLVEYEAVQLFTERAREVQPGFAVSDANAGAVVQVCRRLDGIPLALELAAVWVEDLTVEEIAARLDQRFQLLTRGSIIAPPHHQALRAMIDWSHDRLAEPERALFRQLSVFAGGWTLAAAVEVCGEDVLGLLARLVETSLVVAEDGGSGRKRYRLLETIREYSREKLAAAGEGAAVRSRHYAWCLALAQGPRPATGPEQAAYFDRLELEHDNLRAALTGALAAVEGSAAARLAITLHPFWQVRGYLSEGRRWWERVLTAEGVIEPDLRAAAHIGAGQLARDQGDYPAARAHYEAGLTLYRDLDQERGVRSASQDLAEIAYFQGDYATAASLAEETLAMSRRQEDTLGVVNALTTLGNVAANRGDYATARQLLEEGLAASRDLPDGRMRVNTLIALGDLARRQGDTDTALARFEESLALCRELDDRRRLAYSLLHLGNLTATQGDFAAAHAYYAEAKTLSSRLDDQAGTALALCNLAYVASNQGNAAEARAHAEEGVRMLRGLSDRRSLAFALINLGAIAARQADYTPAHGWFVESLQIARALGDQEAVAFSLEGLAAVAGARGEPGTAARLFGAVEVLREAIGAPLSPADRADYDRSVAALRGVMDEAAFAAAWAAGRALTPEAAAAEALAMAAPVTPRA